MNASSGYIIDITTKPKQTARPIGASTGTHLRSSHDINLLE